MSPTSSTGSAALLLLGLLALTQGCLEFDYIDHRDTAEPDAEVFVSPADAVDLLLVVDGSASMHGDDGTDDAAHFVEQLPRMLEALDAIPVDDGGKLDWWAGAILANPRRQELLAEAWSLDDALRFAEDVHELASDEAEEGSAAALAAVANLEGIPRPGAALWVVFLSDEDDDGPTDREDWRERWVDELGYVPWTGAIVGGDCAEDAPAYRRLADAVVEVCEAETWARVVGTVE